MATRLTIIENDLKKPAEEQLYEVNLALQAINTWGQRQKNQINLDFTDNVKQDINIINNEYQSFGYDFSVTPTSSIIQIILKTTLTTTSESKLGLFIDNGLVDEWVLNISAKNTLDFISLNTISAGVTHQISFKIKGNATKYSQDVKNKAKIISLNS